MEQGETEEIFGKKSAGLSPPNINVTPLIDVLLVLLIIFMVIQPRREAKFESQIPSKPDPNDTTVIPKIGLLVIEVDRENVGMAQMVKLNTKPIALVDLRRELKAVFEQREREGVSDTTVFIKAPRDKAYGDIVYVIDEVKGAGAQPIGLQVDYLE
jgi:biopolymer transport protein ExbD